MDRCISYHIVRRVPCHGILVHSGHRSSQSHDLCTCTPTKRKLDGRNLNSNKSPACRSSAQRSGQRCLCNPAMRAPKLPRRLSYHRRMSSRPRTPLPWTMFLALDCDRRRSSFEKAVGSNMCLTMEGSSTASTVAVEVLTARFRPNPGNCGLHVCQPRARRSI